MAADEENTSLRTDEQGLFGDSSGDEEMSDLEGDQVSDVDQNEMPEQEEGLEEDSAEASQLNEPSAADTAAHTAAPKLPSFKKRTRNISKEESDRLEELKRELREKKQNGGRDVEEPEEEEEVDPQQALRDEIDREFAKALASGKKKRKKVDEEDLERSMDEELSNLREQMKIAAEEDAIANGKRKPAVAKLKLLQEVVGMLTNKHWQDSILDNQLLDAIRLWLEPLPDRSLPSLDIQTEMLDILDKLPIASDHLRESGVGKIVYFYTKSPRIETPVKRKADQLVAKWSRLVIKRSENYRERRHELREYRQEDAGYRRKKFRSQQAPDEEDEKRMHVRIPQAVAADYDIVPQSTVRIDKVKAKNDSTFRRLKNTMRSMKTGPKRTTPKVSIEGKGMGI
ncbi:uncharacterized protein BYT42DRAFT_350360 [Radiomyces spectabilis]|uniref:uncharacterized protein n=1 Tax=Radiomyces spectabilis TaxID=64574 RepID=UPI00221F98F6|nr:uncharacterized protein BYT42DRAFT_350360 [Radiomyces spectabilis]KAI8377608.1 hypothetical protein BYT42DRAFT_350360 [Radiomyces spectabilis]